MTSTDGPITRIWSLPARVQTIARLAAADEDTVRGVIHLFNQNGLAALGPRGQWPSRRISDGDIDVISVVPAATRPEKRGLPVTYFSGTLQRT